MPPLSPGRLLRRVRAGDSRSIAHHPALAVPPSEMTLSSPAFANGGTIPVVHAGRGVGQNRSPALEWSGLPEGTQQLLLVIEDTDVPLPRPILHTIALLDPAIGTPPQPFLPENELAAEVTGVRLVPVIPGIAGYQGPRPLSGHGEHRYGFHLYALSTAIPATAKLRGMADVLRQTSGHLLAAGHLAGVMERY
ncbi:YbhB/YbcL family Raf kinase inhibitor-like protein [Psychromicrobium xiongbiense]|uniref:YbhB/YbcL family Raf kinase inhibitor-like protein n=1 Tax=Psychromicrobium xiongbiense TaxID=3051184 RepID=UPI002556FA91|nr:YbhB/YbcL family Raf kinase inhibitor-like protein [Psychromicrobium sp. YIM S02556]